MNRFRLILVFVVLNSIFNIANAQWVTNGPAGELTKSLVVSGSNIFAACYDGVYRSSDKGGSWTAGSGLPVLHTYNAVVAVNDSTLVTGSFFGGIYRSTDSGANWMPIDTGYAFDPEILSMVVNDTGIFAGILSEHEDVLWSANGTSWATVDSEIGYVWSLAVKGPELFAGTLGGGAYISGDNGHNWTGISKGLTDSIIYSLAVSGNFIYAGTNGGVFVSGNDGVNWSLLGSGLPDSIWAIGVSGSNIFAGTLNYGVYLYMSVTQKWVPVNTGLSAYNIYSFAFSDSTIFAATHDGVWQRPLSDFANTNNAPIVSGTGLPASCYGGNNGSIIVAATGGPPPYRLYCTADSIHYFYVTGFYSVDTIPGLTSGNYTVVITDAMGDSAIISPITVGQPEPLQLALLSYPDTLCSNETARGYCAITGGIPPYSVLWMQDDSDLAHGDTVNDLHTGVFTLMATDMNTCVVVSLDTIYTCPSNTGCSAAFTLYPVVGEANAYYALNQATGLGSLSYIWYWGDGDTSSGVTPSHTYADSGYYTICLTITDSGGCINTDCDSNAYLRSGRSLMINVNVVTQLPVATGIALIRQESAVSVYPNPSIGNWQLEVNHELLGSTLEVFDEQGRLIFKRELLSTKYELTSANLSSGVYYVRISNNKTSVMKKLVKL